MITLQQNRMRTLLPEDLSRVAGCRRTPKVTFRSAKTGSGEVRVRACSSSGELVGSEQPRKQAKKALRNNHSFSHLPCLFVTTPPPAPALCSIPTSSFCQPSSRHAIQSVTTPYKETDRAARRVERELERGPKQSTKKGNENRGGSEKRLHYSRLLRESPPSLVSKLHENKGNRANKHDHKIWAIKSIFCEINNSAGF